MEAARACAIRGHKVRLYEKNVLGGTLNAPATAEFKIQIRKLIEYYKVQLNKLGVEIGEMNKHTDPSLGAATAEDIAENILYFASDSSKNTTGQIVVEDFGSSL